MRSALFAQAAQLAADSSSSEVSVVYMSAGAIAFLVGYIPFRKAGFPNQVSAVIGLALAVGVLVTVGRFG